MSFFMLLLASAALPSIPAPASQCETMFAGDVEKIKAHIWDKELKIYQGRSEGDLSYYLNNSSDHFLAWTAGTDRPFQKDRLTNNGKAMAGQSAEKITTELEGFTVSGTTAVIYYLNHRTVMPNGDAVDQYYDNIHVWVNENCTWNVIGSMSRRNEGKSKK